MTATFPHTVRIDLKNEALKRQLLDCVSEKKRKFLEVAEKFNQLDHRDEKDYLELCNGVIEAANEVLIAGEWDNSLFLRNTIRPLKKIRDQALQLCNEFQNVSAVALKKIPKIDKNAVKLYVSLFQAVGHDMKKWADQLSSLGRHMTGRPVYRDEEAVIKIIRSKLSQTSEAYVTIAVDPSNIISQKYAKPRHDKHGNELISLVPGVVDAHHILEFAHQGKRYHFFNNQLLPVATN